MIRSFLLLSVAFALGCRDWRDWQKVKSETPDSKKPEEEDVAAKPPNTVSDLEVAANWGKAPDGTKMVIGTVKNNTNETYKRITVDLKLYVKGKCIDGCCITGHDIKPRQTWKFQHLAIYLRAEKMGGSRQFQSVGELHDAIQAGALQGTLPDHIGEADAFKIVKVTGYR
jgi:hypothetical protein